MATRLLSIHCFKLFDGCQSVIHPLTESGGVRAPDFAWISPSGFAFLASVKVLAGSVFDTMENPALVTAGAPALHLTALAALPELNSRRILAQLVDREHCARRAFHRSAHLLTLRWMRNTSPHEAISERTA